MRLHSDHPICHTEYSTRRVESRCLGGSLVTLLISLLLSTLIVSGAIQWVQLLKKTVITARVKGQSLEIGRVVFQYMMTDLRAAGYRGCRTLDPNFPIRRNFVDFGDLGRYFRMNRVVFGFHAIPGYCQGRMPNILCKRLKENSDLLVIYNIPKKIFLLKENMDKPDDFINVSGKNAIQSGSIAFISDCQQGDFFIANMVEKERIFHQQGSNANLTNSFSKIYKKNAEVVELQTVAYYLGIPERYKSELHSYSLYRDDLLHEAEEIIEGLIDLKIQYGVWDPEFGIHYKMANHLRDAEWANVRTIRLKLQTKTEEIWDYEFAIRNW